jgi:hypothetical protein
VNSKKYQEMQFEFKSVMEKLSDEELLKVLTVDNDNYLPDALTAAKSEFEKRKLPEDKIGFITNDLVRKKDEENKKAAELLNPGLTVLTFLFPMILTFLLSGFYKSKGYDRKASQLGRWTILGFCFYIIVALLIAYL